MFLMGESRIPKKNPKRSADAKKRRYELKQQYRTEKRNYSRIFMGIIFVGIIVGIIALAVTFTEDQEDVVVIKDGDTATMDYTLWLVDENGDYDIDNPYQASTFDAVFEEGRLIYGFYQECLGLREGQTKTFLLPACVDEDGDGYDDNTNERCMSYGDPNHQLFNTTLRYKVKVNSIQKPSSS